MRAVVVTAPGGPEVLQIQQVPTPVMGPGEVLLDVEAAAVNRADLLQRRGRYPPPAGASDILGLEAAGTVRAVGAEVAGWSAGDRAMALLSGGGYAEMVAVPAGQLMPVPDALDTTHAAGIPEAFLTAWLSLHELARLRPGDSVLVHAAASGVGTAALQIAREMGAARVLGTVRSPAKAATAGELGAVAIVATDGRFADAVRTATEGAGVDVVLDLVGGSYWDETLRSLAVGARVSVVGLVGGSHIDLDLAAMMNLQAAVAVSSLRRRTPAQKAQLVAGFHRWAGPRLADGRLRPLIHAVLPLERAADAHRLLEDNATVGKVVLRVSP